MKKTFFTIFLLSLSLFTGIIHFAHKPINSASSPNPTVSNYSHSGNSPHLTTTPPTNPHKSGHHKNDFKKHCLRSEAITLSKDLLLPHPLKVGQEITLNLFDDEQVVAEISDSFVNVNQTVSTTAKIKGSTWGRVFIANTAGEVRAKIIEPEADKIFAIHFNQADHTYYALEIDPATEEFDEEDVVVNQLSDVSDEAEKVISKENITRSDGNSEAIVVVDVMVLYSNGALSEAGSVTNINNLIALGMAFGRDAHNNSNTGIDFNLVHSQHIEYADTDNRATDLSKIKSSSNIQTLRNTYNADFVNLLVGDYTADGGLADLLKTTDGDPSIAYTVVTYPAFDTYTPVHEIGHNMGLHHTRSQDTEWGPTIWTKDELGLDECAAGWHWHPTPGAKGYCSLMSYTKGSFYDGVYNGVPVTNPYAETDGLSHTRVGVFSDPHIIHRGVAAGDEKYGNNAKVLRAMKSIYAAYRTKSTPANSIAINSPAIGKAWTVGATQQIHWNPQGVTGNVKIELVQNDAVVQVIASNTPNDRTFLWTIPVTVTEGTNYKLRISTLDDSIVGKNNNPFTINKAFYSEPLNSNPGYHIAGGLPDSTDGKWEFGAITGEYHLPVKSPTGVHIYATDLNGKYYEDKDDVHQDSNDIRLQSIAIDCSEYQHCRLKFQRVLSLSRGDVAKVEMSNDETNWHPLYSSLGDYFYTQDWSLQDYDISAYADGKSTVYIRWSIESNSNDKALSGWGIDDIQLVGIHQSTPNNPPLVEAGENQTIKPSETATLTATVSDDNRPSPTSILWSKLDGPGTVTFGTPTLTNTTATFSQVGTYVLKLSASDTQFNSEDVTVITVKNPQTLTFDALTTKNYGEDTFTLNATTDSGLPITYSTSDHSIATVTGNEVTIVGPGTVEIIATQGGNTNFSKTQVRQTLTVNLPYNLQEGWNMLALPCNQMEITDLLATTTTNLWTWNGKEYQPVTTPKPLQGFWIYCTSATTVNLTGTPISNPVGQLSTGWNMYGPALKMKAPDFITYRWQDDAYSLVTPTDGDLLLGHGYWFYANQPETIKLK